MHVRRRDCYVAQRWRAKLVEILWPLSDLVSAALARARKINRVERGNTLICRRDKLRGSISRTSAMHSIVREERRFRTDKMATRATGLPSEKLEPPAGFIRKSVGFAAILPTVECRATGDESLLIRRQSVSDKRHRRRLSIDCEKSVPVSRIGAEPCLKPAKRNVCHLVGMQERRQHLNLQRRRSTIVHQWTREGDIEERRSIPAQRPAIGTRWRGTFILCEALLRHMTCRARHPAVRRQSCIPEKLAAELDLSWARQHACERQT